MNLARGMKPCAVALLLAMPVFGQMSNQSSMHRQAAQLYFNAAAKCPNPAGAACLRQYGNYENCVAGDLSGASCGTAPSCSSACTGSSGAAGTGVPSLGTAGLVTDPKAQAVGNLVGLGLSLLLNHRGAETADQPAPPDPAALQAAEEEMRRQQINNEAANLLNESKSLMASLNSSSASEANATSALDSLLDDGHPSNASTSAVVALLGDSAQGNNAASDSTSTVAALLTDSTSPDSSGASDTSSSLSGVETPSPTGNSVANLLPDEGTTADVSADNQPGAVSRSVGDFYDAVSTFAHEDGVEIAKAGMGLAADQSTSVKAFTEELETAEGLQAKYQSFVSGAAYARDLFSGAATGEENQQAANTALKQGGMMALSETPVAQQLFSQNIDTAQAVNSKVLATFDNAFNAYTSDDASYDQNTDVKNIQYAFTSMIPGFDTMQRAANVLASGQKLVQVTSAAFHQWLYGD